MIWPFFPVFFFQTGAASAFPLYFTAGPSLRQKREAFNKEREDMIKDTEALFRLRKKQASAAKAQVDNCSTFGTTATPSGDLPPPALNAM